MLSPWPHSVLLMAVLGAGYRRAGVKDVYRTLARLVTCDLARWYTSGHLEYASTIMKKLWPSIGPVPMGPMVLATIAEALSQALWQPVRTRRTYERRLNVAVDAQPITIIFGQGFHSYDARMA